MVKRKKQKNKVGKQTHTLHIEDSYGNEDAIGTKFPEVISPLLKVTIAEDMV